MPRNPENPVSSAETRRLQYLRAMGIDIWKDRRTVPESVDNINHVDHPDKTATGVLAPAPAIENAGMSWQQLRQQVAGCQACVLHETRTQTVFGVGPETADWLFVGEAPGADEDAQGEPFVGRAGKLLNAMLFALGLHREHVFIANVLKCRPPSNRDPRPEEVEMCEAFLRQQINLLKPQIIVALGRHAAHNLLKTDQALSRLRGQIHSYENTPLIVTYHPAYLLRSPTEKAKAWQDLCLAKHQVSAT